MTKNKIYRFHDFELDAGKRQLSRDGEILPLSAKPFEVLSCLVENHGELVEKRHLLDRVWENSFVDENILPVQISALRSLFREKGNHERIIKTISGRGYIFTAPVETRTPPPGAPVRRGSTVEVARNGDAAAVEHAAETEARDYVVKGKYIIETAATRLKIEADLYQAIDFFNLAIKLKPDYADAYIGIGQAFYSLSSFGYMASPEAAAKCRMALRQVYAISPRSADVFFLEAMVFFFADVDIHRAGESFRRAIELDERHAGAHYLLALSLLYLGRKDEAYDHYRKACLINPTNITYRNGLIRVYYFSGDFNRAIIRAKEVLEMDGRSYPALYLLSGCYAELGVYDEALRYIEETAKIIDTLEIRFKRAYIRALMNEPEEAERLIAEVLADENKLKMNLLSVVAVYAVRHRIDEAVRLLFDFYRKVGSDILSIKVDPRLGNLRSDARFVALLRELKLV